jgi:hypothetical protein
VATISNLYCHNNIYTIDNILIYGLSNLVPVSLAALTETFIKLFYQDSPPIFLASTAGKHRWINLLDLIV